MTEVDFARTPPQNIEAEQSVLGGCLLSAAAFNDARAILSDDDFYRPAHELIWRAICELRGARKPADAVTVAAELSRQGLIGRVGGHPYLHTLISGVPTAANAGYYAEIVAEKAVLRRLVEAGTRIVQMGYGVAEGAGMEGGLPEALERAHTELALVRGVEGRADATDVDVLDLMREHLPDRPLIPGLLEEGERFILTAAEGLGKSTLLRQILVCASAGLHPFTHRDIDPIKCMGFDYENSRRLSQRRYAPLLRAADTSGHPVSPDMLRLEIRPEGVDLLSRASAMKVLRMVERVQPQLIYIGPIYRLHEGDPNDEREARKITVVLDAMRQISGAAILTEAHMAKDGKDGHRSLRPVGSGLWMRWPEYGYGLVLDEGSDFLARRVEVKPWRGPRDERAWPEILIAGELWPWKQVDSRAGFWRPLDEAPEEPQW